MSVRVLSVFVAGLCLFFNALGHAYADIGDRRAEAVSLVDLDPSGDTVLIDAEFSSVEIEFSLPIHITAQSAELTLAARPADDAQIPPTLTINGETLARSSNAAELELRFEIPGEILNAGANTLGIAYNMDPSGEAWLIDGRRSQIRIDYVVNGRIETLEAVELALAADFGRLERVQITASQPYQTLEALSAQAIAMRAQRVPLFTHADQAHDIAVRFDTQSQTASGPEIRLVVGDTPELVVTGRDADEAIAAARLFAARSFGSAGLRFTVSDALDAQTLSTDGTASIPGSSDLARFANDASVFGPNSAAHTAVVLAGIDDDTRTAAYSILSRAALASGGAWIYAWYGESTIVAPEGRHLLVIGPDAANDRAFMDMAPAELRAALRAANQVGSSRGGIRFAAAAYADGGDDSTAPYGVAAIFADVHNPDRWIATFTAGEGIAFSDAAQTLARSNLWDALEGRAAIWSARGVTPFDFDGNTEISMIERISTFEIGAREIAILLFILTTLFLMRGLWRRRQRVHAVSKDLQ